MQLMLDKFFKIKLQSLFATPPNKIAIAVSGGADSMCLAMLCKKHCQDSELLALIVDHGLRQESAEEAFLVQQRLKALGVDSQILVWRGEKPKNNIQEHARNARYKLMTDYCKAHEINHLCVAHNANDQAETLLLRIFRGSGIDGISGVREITSYSSVSIVRPLLEIMRHDIEEFLRSNKIPWVEDSSNQDEKYERVKMRKLLSSLDDKNLWIERLNLLASNAQRSSDFINDEVTHVYNKYVHKNDLGYMSISFEEFSNIHEEIALKLLVKVLGAFSDSPHQPRLKKLLACKDALLGKQDICLSGVEIKYIKGTIYFIRELAAVENKVADGVWDNRFFVGEQKVEPLGEDGWRKIKKEVKDKTWPHVKVLYALPAIKTKNSVTAPSLLSSSISKIHIHWLV